MPRTNAIKVTIGSGARKREYPVPMALRHKVEQVIQEIEDERLIPAEKVFPELLDDKKRPAIALRASRYKIDMTQAELAQKLKISQHHISEMEHGKRPIGKEMARRFAAVLKCDYRLFL